MNHSKKVAWRIHCGKIILVAILWFALGIICGEFVHELWNDFVDTTIPSFETDTAIPQQPHISSSNDYNSRSVDTQASDTDSKIFHSIHDMSVTILYDHCECFIYQYVTGKKLESIFKYMISFEMYIRTVRNFAKKNKYCYMFEIISLDTMRHLYDQHESPPDEIKHLLTKKGVNVSKMINIWLCERIFIKYQSLFNYFISLDVDIAIPPDTFMNKNIENNIINVASRLYNYTINKGQEDIFFFGQDHGAMVNGGWWMINNQYKMKSLYNSASYKYLENEYKSITKKNKTLSENIDKYNIMSKFVSNAGVFTNPMVQSYFEVFKDTYYYPNFAMSSNVTKMKIDRYQSMYYWRDQIGVSETVLRMCSVFKQVSYHHDCVYGPNYYSCWNNYFTNVFNLSQYHRQCGPICLFGLDSDETRINVHDQGNHYKPGDFFYHTRKHPHFLNHSCYDEYDGDWYQESVL